MSGQSDGRMPKSVWQWMRFGAQLPRLERLYINGADMLDGKYTLKGSLARLRLANIVASAGRPVTITGFSMRLDPPPEIGRAFRALPTTVRLCAREPRTHERLRQLLGRQPIQAADLAFLMQAAVGAGYEAQTLERLGSARRAGRRLVGICPNLLAVKVPGLGDAERAEWAVRCLLEAWYAISDRHPDCVPVVLPHDYRGAFSDVALGAAFIERCRTQTDAIFVSQRVSAPALKAFCAELDVLVTGRMHCGIAALGSGVPAVFMDYQDKAGGLLDLFGLSSSVEADADPRDCAMEIANHVNGYLDRHDEVARKIQVALPGVLQLARQNADPAEYRAGG